MKEAAISAAARLERILISTLMAAITLLTLAQVVWRYILEMPLQWSEEAARYCFVWLTFLGAAALFRLRSGHPAIDALEQSIGVSGRRIVKAIQIVAVLIGNAAIAVGGYRLMTLQWQQLSPSIEIPIVLIYAAMVVGPVMAVFWTLWTARNGSVGDPV